MAMADLISDALYRQIVEGAADAIIVADHEGRIRLWNAGAEALFGHPAADALGQSLDLIIPERLRARHWEGYEQVMAGRPTRYGRNKLLAVPALHADGRRLSLEFSISLLRDDAGALSGIVAILRDVTARWEQERSLRQHLTDLEARVAVAPTPQPPPPTSGEEEHASR